MLLHLQNKWTKLSDTTHTLSHSITSTPHLRVLYQQEYEATSVVDYIKPVQELLSRGQQATTQATTTPPSPHTGSKPSIASHISCQSCHIALILMWDGEAEIYHLKEVTST